MDTTLLRTWLGLPPGPWPPDDRTLLGLGDRTPSPADAERQALAQMAKLRPHQLVHPDLVTEGMNRLAQALLAVSMGSPTAPSPPLRQPTPAPVAQPRTPAAPPQKSTPPPPKPVPSAASGPPPAAVERRPADSVEEIEAVDEDDASGDRVAAPPAATAQSGARPAPVTLTPADGSPDVPAIRVGPRAVERRDAYRELAGLRAVARAWDQLRPFFGDPAETVPTAGHVFDFLEAVAALRSAVRHPGLGRGFVADVAPRTAAVARQPLALAVFRSLTPSQRASLARDWAAGRAWFEAYAVEVRAAVRRSARTPTPDALAATRQFLGRNPEWLMATAAAALALATGAKLILRP